MFEISQIRGKKEVIANLVKVQYNIQASLLPSLINASYKLRDQARENVRNWSQVPGLSITGKSITDIESWDTIPVDNNSVSLICLSNHAAVVELGGTETGATLVEMTKGPGYPIGKQQHGGAIIGDDGKPIIRTKFLIQQPMGYFRSAIDNQSTQGSMVASIKNDLWDSIESAL
jgi:hypothetical protein